jgi:hypothetical protein
VEKPIALEALISVVATLAPPARLPLSFGH